MIELDQQRQRLERRLSASPAPDPILIHPSMAVTYRERVAALIAGLGRSAKMPAANEALRALEAITGTRKSAHCVEARLEYADIIGELVLVAGADNRRNLPTLSAAI